MCKSHLNHQIIYLKQYPRLERVEFIQFFFLNRTEWCPILILIRSNGNDPIYEKIESNRRFRDTTWVRHLRKQEISLSLSSSQRRPPPRCTNYRLILSYSSHRGLRLDGVGMEPTKITCCACLCLK